MLYATILAYPPRKLVRHQIHSCTFDCQSDK